MGIRPPANVSTEMSCNCSAHKTLFSVWLRSLSWNALVKLAMFSFEVYIMPEIFENTALFLQLVNPSRKRTFSKALLKPEKFENAFFVFL